VLEPEEGRLKREAMSAVPKGILVLIFLTIMILSAEYTTFQQKLMVLFVTVFWFGVVERIYKWVRYRRHKARM
jgi:hypothetical protein